MPKLPSEDGNTTEGPSQTPFRRLDEDSTNTKEQEHQQQQQQQQQHDVGSITSSTKNLMPDQEGFVFDGDDECAVIVAPASPTSPFLNANTTSASNNNQYQYHPMMMTPARGRTSSHAESLLQQPLLDPDNSCSPDEDREEDHWSVDHPLSLPFAASRSRRRQLRTSELSGLNILNVTTLLVHVTISILFGSGIVETELQKHNSTHTWLPSTWTVTTLPTYETLLTPAQWAGEYLWIPVLALEGLFCLIQLLPRVRSRTMVVTGVGYLWFYVGICQSLATVFFCLKWIIPAWFALAVNLLCLLVLQWQLQQQQQFTTCPSSQQLMAKWEYWIFRFPFDVHLGWILPLLASRGSMIFRHYGTHDVGLQLAADIVAMALLLPCAGAYLHRAQGPPDWVVPLLILWSYIGIACRLTWSTPPSLEETYGSDIIIAVRDAAWCFAGTVGLFTIPQIAVWVAREFLTIQVVQLSDEDEDHREHSISGNLEDDDLDDLVIPEPSESHILFGTDEF